MCLKGNNTMCMYLILPKKEKPKIRTKAIKELKNVSLHLEENTSTKIGSTLS